jgi:transformation/transcription domain-associated protein
MGTSGSGSSPSRSSNNEESLGLHGIQPHPSLGDQKEVVLLREVEAKQRQLKIYQQDFMKAKEVVLAKGPLGNGPGATPEGKVALEDAKKQLRITRTACDKVSKDLADVRKRYADEVAQKKAADQQTSVKDQSTVRPMIIDSLELQHQGFCLVNALVRDDVNYLQDHTDILRAFRWLWRSKGRFLRMQYEESIPPRYHGESQALGSFLVSYSRSSPHDVDLLFELIRIFLQPMTSDFWFIRKFLNQATGNGLEDGQKKQILERFFALMGGDSSEEIKALSLQLVIYPTLYFSFHKQPSGLSSEETPATASNSLQPKSCGFLDSITVQKFISDVLFKNGKPVTCDDRLVVGFLQISDLFLEFVPHYFENKGDEMLKYCWVHLKNEIPSCKSWAQFVICRYISVFSMPQQMILQVYDALLDSHQQEGKQLIQNGLDLLVSTFPQKLDRSGLKAAVDTTIKVMFKEANSTAQLSHIFHVIVHEPDIFFHKRSVLASFMINSLNRLGLPPNSPTENRILAVLMIELVVKWEKGQEKIEESEDAMDISAETGSEDTAFPDIPVRFDCAMVETIINFLIRLKILLADPKVDTTTVNIQPKLDLLLQDILNKWKGALIRPIYFEKVVSMCNEDEEVHIRARLIQNTESQHSTKGSRSPEGRSAGKDDEIKKSIAALNGIMIACLDIFKFLAVGDPLNPFLMENTVQLKSILGACFRCASFLGEVKLRRKLFDFLIPYLSLIAGDTPMIDVQVVHSITVWVEKILIDAEVEHRTGMTSLGGELSRHTRPRQMMPPDDSHLEDCPTMFALKVVKMVRDNASPFSKTFTSTLLALLGTIVKQHTLQAGSNQKQNGVNYNPLAGTVSIRHMYPTPTFGLLEETELAATHHLVGIGKPTEDKHLFPYKEVKNHDVMLHFGTMILDVVGKDDLVFEFSWCRKSLLSLLQSILDTSDNIQIMLAAVHLVGRWLVAGDSGPLTTKERTVFLGKIASFDFTGISEVASQPLVEVVSFYLKSLFHCDGPKRVQDVVDKHEMMLRRSISACLVSANVETRDFMLNLFLQEECTEPFAVLWRFFNGDLEGLGGRHWVIVLVELLLRIITPKEEHGTTENLPPPTPRFVLKESDMGAGGQLEYLAFAERLQEDAMDMSTKKGGEELKVALRQLAHGDPRICQSLFETIFPSAWHSVADIHLKESMASRIESFLSQSFHSQSFKKDFSFSEAPQNSIKSFLSGLVKLDPGPIFDIDLLMHLARSYNCWYEAMFMLENQYFALSASSLSSEGKKKLDKLLLGMRYCYRELGEVDIWTSLVLKSCHVPGSKFAASLDIYGKVDKALEAFSGLIELVDSEESLGASEFEMDFWEERWVHLHQQQQQLDVVSEYAKQSQNERLMLECAWRERDWDKVRSLCSSGPIVAAVEAGDPAMKICETLSAVADGKLADVENLHAQASQLALYQWQFLPCLSSGSGAHARLLHYFHRLVEIRESGQIMVETNNHSSGKTLPDLKNLLK